MQYKFVDVCSICIYAIFMVDAGWFTWSYTHRIAIHWPPRCAMLHNHVNKCGECKLQLISNLFDVIRISVDSKTTFHTFWLHLATKHSTFNIVIQIYKLYDAHTMASASGLGEIATPMQICIHNIYIRDRWVSYRFESVLNLSCWFAIEILIIL